MNFPTIFKQLRKEKKLTQEQIADRLGVSKSTVSMYENGGRVPPYEMMERIGRLFDVDMNRLFGQPSVAALPHNLRPVQTRRFPLLGEIACGEPIVANAEYEVFVDASSDVKADFCLTAKGDSMIGARILDGDVVFIRAQEMVENGKIAAVIIDNEATLKRWYYFPEKQKLILTPENPAYEPLVFIGDELSDIKCIGQAVSVMSRL